MERCQIVGDGTQARRRTRAWVMAALVGLSSLSLAMLAVATNLATSAVPKEWKQWTSDPWLMWTATGVLTSTVVILAMVLQRFSNDKDDKSASEISQTALALSNLPPRNPSFTGRDGLLRQLATDLAAGPVAVVAVRGLGGIGKSQIALEFAHRGYDAGQYGLAWWVHAESPVGLVEDFADLARGLGLHIGSDQDETVVAVRAALQSRSDWLLIFDNVPTPDQVLDWLPGGTGDTVITSRERGWSSIATQIDVMEFSREESICFLEARACHYNETAAKTLAIELGDLPLALAQAAGYLEIHDLSIDAYLDLFHDREAAGRLLSESIAGYPASVATTWLLHYERLAAEYPASLELLRLSSFLHPEEIDLDLLLSRPELLPAILAAAAKQPYERESAIGALTQTGLITRLDDHRLRMHRLVSQVTRQHLTVSRSGDDNDDGDVTVWAKRAVKLLRNLFPENPSDPAQWELCAELAPHVTTAVDHAKYYDAFTPDADTLLTLLTTYLESQVEGELVVVKASSARLVRSAYLQQVRQIAPHALINRDRELAELASFCTGDDRASYMWLRAPAWAGKSALLSYFVQNPPPDVTVVSFFITSRYAGQSDRFAFTEAVLEQLAELLSRSMPAYLTEAALSGHFLQMLADAAKLCQRQGRRLVLVVDGLDEDRGVTAAYDRHSIASLLPTHPVAGMRTIVSGRLHPPLPADVPPDHPLRDPRVVHDLELSAWAEIIRTDNERELTRLTNGSPLEQDLLGLMVAAEGGLSASDLAELTGSPVYQVEAYIRSAAGRSFVARSASTPSDALPTVYMLAHEQLHDAAVIVIGKARLADYRQRIHAWAEIYRSMSWPENTPEYLLTSYGGLLLHLGDIARMVTYATDAARRDRIRKRTGGDTVTLIEISNVRRFLLERVATIAQSILQRDRPATGGQRLRSRPSAAVGGSAAASRRCLHPGRGPAT
jgi:hypothetical protein